MTTQSNTDTLDLIIIGAAAAGCAAAIYAARRNLNFRIIAKDIGGEVALSGEVENWPGIIHTTGFELAQSFYKHVESYGAQADIGSTVTDITKNDNIFSVTTQNYGGEEKVYQAKSVIIASGIHPKMLKVDGEESFKNKGVTYCTVCDGPLYKGKVTATIGAGNSALESALMMSEIAKKVYLITKFSDTPETKGGFPKGEDILINKVKKCANVEIIYSALTTQITGDDHVTELIYTDNTTQESHTISIDGVMIHIGNTPNSHFVTIADKAPTGEIITDLTCTTSVPGLFAAGDVTAIPYKQIAISAGQGVTAALSAIEYLNKLSA